MYTGGTNWVFAHPPPLNQSPPKFSWGVLCRSFTQETTSDERLANAEVLREVWQRRL